MARVEQGVLRAVAATDTLVYTDMRLDCVFLSPKFEKSILIGDQVSFDTPAVHVDF